MTTKSQSQILRDALTLIIDGVPIFADGAFITEHFSPDGEPIGVEQHDPVAIIQCMLGVASEALTAGAEAEPSESASAPTVKVERNRVWIVKGVQSFMLAYEADTDEELQRYAGQLRGILSGITKLP